MTAYVIRTPAALLAVASISTATALTGPTQQAAQASAAARERAGGAAHILLNGSPGEAGTAELLFVDAARWFERADLDERIVLSHDSSASYWDIASQEGTPVEAAPDVLTVNPTYLSEQVVLSENGLRLTPEALPSGRPTVLVPAGRAQRADAVVAQAVEDLELARNREDAGPLPAPERATIAGGQELLTHGAAAGSSRAVVRDAFLVVVPPQLGTWGPEHIDMAESIVLREPGPPADVRADPRLATAVLATAVPVIVVAAAVAVCARAWATRRFVRGWSRVTANPVLLASEAAVLAVVLLLGARPWPDEQVATPPDPSIPPPPPLGAIVEPDVQLAVTVVVVLLSAVVAAIVLRSRERNIIADRAIDRM